MTSLKCFPSRPAIYKDMLIYKHTDKYRKVAFKIVINLKSNYRTMNRDNLMVSAISSVLNGKQVRCE